MRRRRGGSSSAPTWWTRRRRSRPGAFDEVAEPDQVLHRATEVARARCRSCRAEAYATVKQQLRGPVLEAALAQPDPLLEGLAGSAETADAAANILRS